MKWKYAPRDATFLVPKIVGGGRPFPTEICDQSDPPPFKQRNFDKYRLIAPQPSELAKKVQLAPIGSRPRAFQQTIDEPCTLPLSRLKGGIKRYCVFLGKFQLLSKKRLLQSFDLMGDRIVNNQFLTINF